MVASWNGIRVGVRYVRNYVMVFSYSCFGNIFLIPGVYVSSSPGDEDRSVLMYRGVFLLYRPVYV